MSRLLNMLIGIAVLSTATLANAGSYDAAFGQVQRMISLSSKNDEVGLEAARQQLERIPKPARQNTKEARTLNQQGLDVLKRNEYSAAATIFQKAQETDPADIEIAGNLGYATLKLGQFKRAEHQLVYAVSLAPNRSSSWFNLGQVYGALGETEKATGAFANAYRFSQNRAKTEEFMQQALTAPENNETTRTALKQALALFSR